MASSPPWRRQLSRLGRTVSQISMASRLSLAILAITLLSLGTTIVVSLQGGESASVTLGEQAQTTQLQLAEDQISRYVQTLRRQTELLINGQQLSREALRLRDAFDELSDEAVGQRARRRVEAFYREDFVPTLQERTGLEPSWPTLLPQTSSGLELQHAYIVAEEDPASRRLVNDAGDGSTWSAVHSELHPAVLDLTERLGVQDLYLVDPRSGQIVYSTAKAVDFATGLDDGPHSGTALAQLMRQIREDPVPGEVQMSDLAPYVPALGSPEGFLGGPLYVDDDLAAILLLRLPVDQFNQIMTYGGEWGQVGLGRTGETFLLGPDGRMRSNARGFIEDSSSYVDAVEEAGTATEDELASMVGTRSTIVHQQVIDPASLEEAVVHGGTMRRQTNHVGRPVLEAYAALEIPDVEWFVGTQMALEEVSAPAERFRNALLTTSALLVLVITFATVAWARGVFGPLLVSSDALRRATAGEDPPPLDPSPRAPKEFAELAGAVDQMLQEAETRQAEVERSSQARLSTMRSFLPGAVADRMEAGDRRVLDEIPLATIVVVVVHGLGHLVEDTVGAARDHLDTLIGELDVRARGEGLEPVKLLGDAYFAGCGLGRPVLDHAPRGVAFARAARTVPNDMLPDLDVQLSVGVAAGEVVVGLSGSDRLAYDLWGETVRHAKLLARTARPGEVLISDRVHSLVPESVPTARVSARVDHWIVVDDDRVMPDVEA